MDWPPYIASVLSIKTEQASFLIGSTVIAMVTEDDFVSIAYLKTPAPSLEHLFHYHKFLIRFLLLAVKTRKLLLFYEPGHFHITHEVRN